MDERRGRLTGDGIRIHEAGDVAGMALAGRVAGGILDAVPSLVFPGQTTGETDRVITAMVAKAGAVSATLGCKWYRHAPCISVNHVICHGIPGDRVLEDGDILNIDVSLVLHGWYADTSRMYVAGMPSKKAQRLMEVTHDALMLGIEVAHPGATFGDIGAAIQAHVNGNRMSVVRDFCGHGLGQAFHAPTNVLHYGRPGTGPRIEEGMFFTIEPIVNLGRRDIKILADEWTAVTRDKSLSAQFEHSVGITATGAEVFTASPAGLFHPTVG